MTSSYFLTGIYIAGVTLAVGCSNTEMAGGNGGGKRSPKSSNADCKEVDKTKCNQKPGGEPLESGDIESGDGAALIDPSYLITPALAVRKANCLMCHGSVKGDVITDFNLVNSPFNTRAASIPAADITQKILIETTDGIRPRNWNTVSIDGKLVIPQIEIQDKLLPSFAGATAGFTLEKALVTPQLGVSDNEKGATQFGLKAINNVGPLRDKSQPGVNEISTYKEVKIDPPTADEIAKLLTDPTAKEVAGSINDLKIVALGESTITGLQVKTGSKGKPYAIGKAGISCKGDIVIGGSLVLQDVGSIALSDKSCRLYVQKSIFIKGSLKSEGDPKLGIQLGAGNGIVAGIRFARLAGAEIDQERANIEAEIEDAGPQYNIVELKADGTLSKVLASTTYEPGSIPTPGMEDFTKVAGSHWSWLPGAVKPSVPNCQFPGVLYKDVKACVVWMHGSVAGQPGQTMDRKSADYIGVLFASQVVFSRYVGTIKGVVVADFALGALDKLKFESDNRFDKVPVLPKLKRSIVVIKK